LEEVEHGGRKSREGKIFEEIIERYCKYVTFQSESLPKLQEYGPFGGDCRAFATEN
jgi:hypothetical protein